MWMHESPSDAQLSNSNRRTPGRHEVHVPITTAFRVRPGSAVTASDHAPTSLPSANEHERQAEAETTSIASTAYTLILPVAALVQCKLGRALGHEELFEQGLDHFPNSVRAADVERVHTAVTAGRRFPGVRTGLRRFAEFHLHFNEASVNPVRILRQEDKHTLSWADSGILGKGNIKTKQGDETITIIIYY